MAWSWPAFPAFPAPEVGPLDLGGDIPQHMGDPHIPVLLSHRALAPATGFP